MQDQPSKPNALLTRTRGRPRAAEAAQIGDRIITAATAIFLKRGFERTTLDHVADIAHVGKTTLYSRFADKPALFAAVLERYADDLRIRMGEITVTGDRRERLHQAGVQLARLTLTPHSIDLMRFGLAETPKFPEIGRQGMVIGFGGCVQSIITCISDDPDKPDHATKWLATRFVELALHPLYFHAFSGANLADLRVRAELDVEEVARLLTNAS